MLHHKLLHFPIALILVGVVVELLALATKRERLEWLAGIFLWVGVVGLIATVGSGLWVEDNFGDARIPTHRNWGLAALGAGVLALVCQLLRGRWEWLRWGRALGFGLSALFVIITGDLGGDMGHGEDAPPPKTRARAAQPKSGASSARRSAGDERDDEPIVLPRPGPIVLPRPGSIVLPPPGRIVPKRSAPMRRTPGEASPRPGGR